MRGTTANPQLPRLQTLNIPQPLTLKYTTPPPPNLPASPHTLKNTLLFVTSFCSSQPYHPPPLPCLSRPPGCSTRGTPKTEEREGRNKKEEAVHPVRNMVAFYFSSFFLEKGRFNASKSSQTTNTPPFNLAETGNLGAKVSICDSSIYAIPSLPLHLSCGQTPSSSHFLLSTLGRQRRCTLSPPPPPPPSSTSFHPPRICLFLSL